MSLEIIFFYIGVFFLGSIFGSFACCQAWRIHQKSSSKLGNRSVCMHCHHQLAWYDNIPLVSWLSLRGKCRYCKTKIGLAEILSELGLGFIFFALVYKYASSVVLTGGPTAILDLPPVSLFQLFILLVFFTISWIILIYDAKWGELPVVLMLINIALAILYQFFNQPNWQKIALAAAIFAGIYYLLYFFSKEKLVGGGDWILCFSIGIILGHWQLVIIELFLSNFAAVFAGIPQIISGKHRPIPFGPFLILAMFMILLVSDYLLNFLIFY